MARLLADSGQCSECHTFGWLRAFMVRGRTICQPCHAKLVAAGKVKAWRRPVPEDELIERAWQAQRAATSVQHSTNERIPT